ncbi:G patch domain-containing protein TGH [Prosopis cineraria]|uniref:G patch domain-containing protein TGH n=1 Tax=Prosopis cineraria TaxID=364024 RepID=UPI0024103D3D|nr:G patch domain-containing protein TGH [Prosopis cineraria]
MESEDDDYVFYGTPIEREEDITSRKKKAVAEASGHLRTLPVWKQEVRDEEGRRRFHGAFTGGFSAGYYNTVGSKEGWAPQSFTSSRKNRAEVKQQSILNFLDDDEKEELEGRFLGTSSQFDTFGFTAAEIAHKQAEKEQQKRPSIIPGPAPDELVLPATESVGVKLLLKMGWRRGRSIKDSHSSALHDARRQARRAFIAFSMDDPEVQTTDSEPLKDDIHNSLEETVNDDISSSKLTPVYILNPKQDLYGLGFDPYKHAPEFREKKRLRTSSKSGSGYSKGFSMKDSLFGLKSGKVASGFGIGALEELDDEDVDVYAGHEYEDTFVHEVEEPSNLENKKKVNQKNQSNLPGFRVASNADYQMERFEVPVIPKDFVPHHTFSGPLEIDHKHYDVPPLEVPPPEDGNLKILVEGVANLVARCGKLFEDLSREKNQSNPLFNFLSGGTGHDYYARKLWEARQKRNHQIKQPFDGRMHSAAGVQRLTAENRGQILGEKPLERSFQDPTPPVASDVHLQFNLTDTFTKPASFSKLPEFEKPFKDDPAKQERFERFLKEKYEGGLRSTSSSLAGNMSEAARARERLDFEAAAEAIEKGKCGKGSKLFNPSSMDFAPAGTLQFTSGGVEPKKDLQTEDSLAKKIYPNREEFQWRPSPLLCKRFDLIDPYIGKPPPAPRIRSRIDSLIFTSDSVKDARIEEPASTKKNISHAPQFGNDNATNKVAGNEAEVDVEVENVERPVDLYKAIFSDDSDDEGEESNVIKEHNQEKKAEVANTALSRLIAGDFLESLGKELGLEVPPDMPYPAPKFRNPAPQNETAKENARNDIPNRTNGEVSLNQRLMHAQDDTAGISESDLIYGNVLGSGSSKAKGTSTADGMSSKFDREMDDDRKVKTPRTPRHDYGSGSSSEEERSRKRTRHESGSIKTKGAGIADSKSNKFIGEKDGGRKIKTASTRHQDYSSLSSGEERDRKHAKHHRHRRRDSGSDSSGDDNGDPYCSRSNGRNKGSSREKSRSRKHSKHHDRRRRDSPSRSSRHRKEKDHADAKREKKRRE